MLFRKIATILLLSFLFFNWVGYWLFISWMESRAETFWELRLNNDQYDPTQLVRIKVSAERLPYSNASTGFERADGKIDIGVLHYRYIGKRLYNDSLEFLCLPDQEANRLQTAKNTFFGLVNDLQNAGHSKAPGSPEKLAGHILKICFSDPLPYLTVRRFPADAQWPGICHHISLPSGYTRISKLPPREERII